METLIVLAQHKDQYYSRSKMHSPSKFGSSSCRGFRELNCQAFESRAGLLPNPWVVCASTVSNRALSSPKTPTPIGNGRANAICKSEDGMVPRKCFSSSPIPINFKGNRKEKIVKEYGSSSERWAGPAYSNSPPPSSLPIPKFSLKPKRTVSLELPSPGSGVDVPPIAKSAPASPTRLAHPHPRINFQSNDDSATKTLRRILNLDIADE
ncbi:hypothetical protein Dimus_016903 [Dionaea muscipula]